MSRDTAFCNLRQRWLIPQGVNLRVAVLLAGLGAGVLHGQTAALSQPASGGGHGTGTTVGGAEPTRANGPAPTAPGLSSKTRSAGQTAGVNGGGTKGSSAVANRPPAPAATDKIEVIGFPAENRTGTVDRPLLPIVSARNSLGIRSGTPIRITLRSAVDSGHAHNGDMLDGKLAAPLAGLPMGTPVRLTVVAVAKAGQLSSFGELSLQVVSIDNRTVLSDTITAQGKEGSKELPDAAPTRGTEAIFNPGEPISLPAS